MFGVRNSTIKIAFAFCALTLAIAFQNCAKKGVSGESDLGSSGLVPLDANQSIKVLSDGSAKIASIRLAAFYGTFPSQNPGGSLSGAAQVAFDNCLVNTNPDGSFLQSRPNKTCPFSLSVSTLTTGTTFHFAILDGAFSDEFPLKSANCTQSGITSLVSGSLATTTTTTACSFQASSGQMDFRGVMKTTFDLLGKSRLEDKVKVSTGGLTNNYEMISDSLVSPAIPLTYTINGASPATLPVDTQYPSAAVWALFAF